MSTENIRKIAAELAEAADRQYLEPLRRAVAEIEAETRALEEKVARIERFDRMRSAQWRFGDCELRR